MPSNIMNIQKYVSDFTINSINELIIPLHFTVVRVSKVNYTPMLSHEVTTDSTVRCFPQ